MLRKTLISILILFALFIGYQVATFPRVSRLAKENPEVTAFMEQRKARLRAEGRDDRLRHTWVAYERISPHLRSAVIVSEDSRFYDHSGVDTVELEKVLREAWKTKELGRGGSTITQQLAKNLYLSPSRNPWRKVKELLIAKRIEQVLEKRRILEIYLNVVELGERVYGAEAAARHYFGKSAAALSPAEAALLAGALPNPRKMNPGNPGPYLRSRQKIILSRMQRWGYIAERSVNQPDEPQTFESEPVDPRADATEESEDLDPSSAENVDERAEDPPASGELALSPEEMPAGDDRSPEP